MDSVSLIYKTVLVKCLANCSIYQLLTRGRKVLYFFTREPRGIGFQETKSFLYHYPELF
jgi:hypothetical protein